MSDESALSEESGKVLISIFTDKLFNEIVTSIIEADKVKTDDEKVQILSVIKSSIEQMILHDLNTAVSAYTNLRKLKEIKSGDSDG